MYIYIYLKSYVDIHIYIYMNKFEKSKSQPTSLINLFIFEINQTP